MTAKHSFPAFPKFNCSLNFTFSHKASHKLQLSRSLITSESILQLVLMCHLLSLQIANLLDCTTWTGAGPGFMDAAIKGALEAKKPVGGFKIGREAGEWTTSNFHPYLPSEMYLTCRY